MKRAGAFVVLGVAAFAAGAQPAPDGAALFAQHCAACHQPDGAGTVGLAPAIRRVADGEVWLDPAIAGQVLAALASLPVPGSPSVLVAGLTAREREVLTLLAEGLSNAELAARLFVGAGTVKTHISRILFKTGCRDRAQATALAFTSGLVVVR